jgi:radical SAM superfamily enzyme YgiQ (UPF0313 family)
MKVLFVYSSDFSSQPIGLMTLSAVLKKNGYTCDFLDLKFEHNALAEVMRIKPDILAYSIVSFTWQLFADFNLRVKKHLPVFSVFGGPHCSIYPDFIEQQGVDALCIGEGEDAMLELTQALSKGEDICHIPNLWVKKEGVVYKNEVRPLEENLDRIPFLDQELIRKYQFFKNIGSYYIMTSRGCPYNCPYCINHFYRKLYQDKGKYIRRRSIENVIEELLIMKQRYGARLIIFNDDIFTLDMDWLQAFAPVYKEKIALPFDAYIRVDSITPGTVDLLKDMGCSTVYLGIESGNPEIRYHVLKRRMTNETIIEVCRLFKARGIKTMSFNMLGLPDETFENGLETMEVNISGKVTYPMCFIFRPFPGIELTRYAIEKGYYDGDLRSFNKSLIHGRILIRSKDARRLERLQYLFIPAVRIPALRPVIRFLTRVPLDPLYRIILMISRFHVLSFNIYRPSLRPYLIYQLKIPFYKLLPFMIKK